MIKGIIFDLGNTLIRLPDDWEYVNRAGAEAMATWYMKKKHIKLDSAALIENFLAERDTAQTAGQQTEGEIVAEQWLRSALARIDAPASAAAFTEAAVKVFFGPQEKAIGIIPDAIETLKTCRAGGLKTGLYSNAPDDALVQRVVNGHRLRPWLSPVFSSAGYGWRKPKPEPFLMIAERWGLEPSAIVVVGDTPATDILGAQQAGMRSILVTLPEIPPVATDRNVQPDAEVECLTAIPDIITQW